METDSRLRLFTLLLTLVFLASCGGQGAKQARDETTGTRALGERERLAPGASLATEAAPVEIFIDESPRPTGVERAQFFILGFPAGALKAGQLTEGVVPSYFWSSPMVSLEEWPISVEAPIPEGLDLLVIRDVDLDGRPGVVDRRSAVLRGGDSDEPLKFILSPDLSGAGSELGQQAQDRVESGDDPGLGGFNYDASSGLSAIDPADADPGPGQFGADPGPGKFGADLGLGGEEGSADGTAQGALLTREGEEVRTRTLLMEGTKSRVPTVPAVAVMLVGFTDDQLIDGSPRGNSLPTFSWRHAPKAITFPQRLEVQVPTSLNVLAFLDLDDDSQLSEGDMASVVFKVQAQDTSAIPVTFSQAIERPLPSQIRLGSPGLLVSQGDLRLSKPPSIVAGSSPPVFVLGYEPEQLVGGLLRP